MTNQYQKRLEYHKSYYQGHKEALKKQSKESKIRNREENRLLKEANKLEIPISLVYLRRVYLEAHPLSKTKGRRGHRERNKDILSAKAKIWYQRNKERIKLEREERNEEYKNKAKSWRYELKIEVLTHYGNGKLACIKCGEARVPCLSIDHINNKGCQHRRELYGVAGKSIYYWLKENGYPEGYQTLCMNCQFCKQAESSGWYESPDTD